MAVALQSVTGSPRGSALLKANRSSNNNLKREVLLKNEANNARVIYSGIEVEPQVEFRGWKVGKKYTKKIVLKNVTFQTQKLNYQPPIDNTFTVLYPKTITLSPGTSFAIPITFNPVKREVVNDKITFQNNQNDVFEVYIKGLLPEYKLCIPDILRLGVGATHDLISGSFEISNESELETSFMFIFQAPFEIIPKTAVIPPYQKLPVVVNFVSNDAKHYILEAVLLYGNKFQHSAKIKLEGISKYSHVMFSIDGEKLENITTIDGQLLVNFGVIPFGAFGEKYIQLQNPSVVGATVDIKRMDQTNPIDWVFNCPVTSAPITPKSTLNISLRYSPKLPRTKSVEYFHVKVSNKCGNLVIKCVGESTGPKVTISTHLINFFQLESGQKATQPIRLQNHGEETVFYQFDFEATTSVFNIDKPNGVIHGKADIQLIVTFRPSDPIQYYRRLALLVPDQEPQFLDLLGTCHDIHLRPNILEAKHLHLFSLRSQRGLSYFSPEQLNKFLEEKKISVDENGSLFMQEAEELEKLCEPFQPLPPWKEFFYGDGHSDVVFNVPHVVLETTELDFGHVQDWSSEGIFKTLCLKNNTQGAVLFNWVTHTHSPNSNFEVKPKHFEIPANGSATVTVNFKPDVNNKIFDTELEGFAYFKSQRDFQIVNKNTFAPPFCISLRCTGHTFRKNTEPFQPHFAFDRKQLVFPSVNVDEVYFRSVSLYNSGDTPIYFTVKDLNIPFAIRPTCGVVRVGECRVFSVRCIPTKIEQFISTLHLMLNERPEVNAKIPLLGSADRASIFLQNKGELYFPQTNIGNAISRCYSVKNTSRVPMIFDWKIHHTQSGIVSVNPCSGRLEPNESLAQTWTFLPQDVGKVIVKPILVTQGISRTGALTEKSNFPLRIIGQGGTGSMRAVDAYVDFGTIVVGTSSVRLVTLINESDCAIYYRLVVHEKIDGPYDESIVRQDPSTLELSQVEGWLHARCKQLIRVTMRPMRRVHYQHELAYIAMSNPDESGNCKPLEEHQHLCHLLCTGVYPTLTVTDLQSWGSARALKKKLLWDFFSVDALNLCLHADPTSSEIMYSVATRQSFCRTPKILTRAVLDFNFGAAPYNSDKSCVNLLLENTGHVATNFHFLMPEELQLDLEFWAESGEYTEEELHHFKVQEDRRFTITPNKGKLDPGASVAVEFGYSHNIPGTDRLPVLMKVDKGREILLNFVGVTTEPNRKYLHFHSKKHTFSPIAIGDLNPTVQVYNLYNGGDQPLKFILDTTVLSESRLENFDHQVLECLNPKGEIQPGRSFEVQFRFSPLEARTYIFDIPIQILDGETALISFCGVGFDKRALGDEQPSTDLSAHPTVASKQAIPLKDQLVYLSQERIGYGNVPVYSRNRRVVFLNNTSFDHPVTFQWHVTQKAHSKYITISPAKGKLEPRESVACHVSLVPCGNPRLFDMDLICEVTDLVQLDEYFLDLRTWQEELRKQTEEFTITEKNLNADKLMLQKQKALPPIKGNEVVENGMREKSGSSKSSSSKYKKDLTLNDFITKPTKPSPFILHLGVTARALSITEFQANLPEQWEQVCMDRTLVINDKSAETTILRSRHAQDFESDVVEDVVINVVQSILGDSDLLAAISTVHQDLVPYYKQLPDVLPHANEVPSSPKEAPPPTPSPLPDSRQSSAKSSSSSSSSSSSDSTGSAKTRQTKTMKSHNVSDKQGFEQEQEELEKEDVLKSVQFGTICESVFENMLLNIISEANHEEFDVTARPRLIALPPRRKVKTPQNLSNRST